MITTFGGPASQHSFHIYHPDAEIPYKHFRRGTRQTGKPDTPT